MKPDAIPSLFRYFIWASLMRERFEEALKAPDGAQNLDSIAYLADKPFIYMAYWFAGLYVVVEGWKELGLQDPAIDSLLKSPSVDLLRRFRNGAFHYQQSWLDARLTDFCGVLENVEWTRSLTAHFGRYLNAEVLRIARGTS
jgi:hypothetical protein